MSEQDEYFREKEWSGGRIALLTNYLPNYLKGVPQSG